MTFLIEIYKVVKFKETENRTVIPEAGRKEQDAHAVQ